MNTCNIGLFLLSSAVYIAVSELCTHITNRVYITIATYYYCHDEIKKKNQLVIIHYYSTNKVMLIKCMFISSNLLKKLRTIIVLYFI